MAEQNAPAVSSTGDKEILIERLQKGRDRYLCTFHGVLDSSSSWCAEHVAVAEEQMLRAWEKLAEAGASDPAKDAMILTLAHDRTRKAKAPERSEPTGRYESLFEALERFRAARERTLQFAEGISVEELRAKVVPHPLAGTLDGYQLLTLMAVHPERHALQVEEIKTDREFPAGYHP
jgi:16S rRNA C967 or C1407 C5-methylase (RsmB/RsmF family)